MAKRIESVVVMGLGRVGSLAATLLHETGFDVLGVDSREDVQLALPTSRVDIGDGTVLTTLLGSADAVVACLPYHLTIDVAKAAHAQGVHYFDLTEDVPTAKEIIELSDSDSEVMAPQCGLAPGFIAIVGAALSRKFDTLRSIELRVGALPQHPRGLLGYAFNWSPEGVVNEYLNDCEVITDGEKKLVPPMGQVETIVIHGNQLEAFTTSGGLGTMCDSYLGRVHELNYKTLRYPGHCKLMRFFFQELHMKHRREEAGDILVNAKPPVSDDVVYIHAAAEGHRAGRLMREEFVRAYYPRTIAQQQWRAIAWTTAASVCAVLELVASGVLPAKGFIKQEDIPLDAFLATRNGALYTAEH
jgi:saccharopine dehydrogenase (NAD+, L-lysine-forming)